eukprot:COSAG06_NODE_700_length_12958_cov_24.639941_7_plen_195_part_01
MLPAQFSALCGVPVATVKCNLERIDFTAAPPDLVCAHGLLTRATTALQTMVDGMLPVMAQYSSPYGFSEGGEGDQQHEIPDDVALHRSDAQLLEDAAAAADVSSSSFSFSREFAKADIPGAHRKPRSNRPACAVRWDGSRGDWLDDDGNVALPPPMDDSEFCAELNGFGRVGGHGQGLLVAAAGEHIVDQTMLEI